MMFVKTLNGYLDISKVVYIAIGNRSFAGKRYFMIVFYTLGGSESNFFVHSEYENLDDAENAIRRIVDSLNTGGSYV